MSWLRAFFVLFLLAFPGCAPEPVSIEEPVTVAVPAGNPYTALLPEIEGVIAKPAASATAALQEVSQKDVRFALVQEDAVREHVQKGRPLAVVGRVYYEYLHILVRSPLRVESASDFHHLRIGIESGSAPSVARFLGGLGIPLSSERISKKPSLDLLSEALQKGLIDVAMTVVEPASTPICRGLDARIYELSPLDYGTLRSLVTPGKRTRLSPQFEAGHLPAGTYPRQREPLAMAAVPVWLVAHPAEGDPALSATLLQAARSAWRSSGRRGSRGCARADVPLPEVFPEVSDLPVLQGMDTAGVLLPVRLRRLAPGLAVVMGIALAAWVAWQRGWHRSLRREWRRDRLTLGVVFGLGLCVLLITVATFLVERNINENFSSIEESFWSITIYLFSGLEDRTPYTTTGRVIAALGLLLGPAFFAVLSGWLARFFIQRERRMPQNLRDHYLFLNWNDRAVSVARELHHPLLTERYGTSVIVALTDDESLTLKRLKESGSGRDEAFEDFYLSIGDPTSERALLNANAQDARTILVFADPAQGGDERTIRSLMMLRRIARDRGLQELHVIAELLDSGNEAVLDEIAKDFPGLLERVSGLQVRTFLLAQAAMNPGLVQFYLSLLQVSAESNEVYTLPIPEGAVGADFRSYAAKVLQAPLPDPMTPVGIQRVLDGRVQILTNPRPGCEESRLRSGDRLVVLSYQPPDPGELPQP